MARVISSSNVFVSGKPMFVSGKLKKITEELDKAVIDSNGKNTSFAIVQTKEGGVSFIFSGLDNKEISCD